VAVGRDRPPKQSEGDVNRSSRRAEWAARHRHPAGDALLEEDARYFLHQSVSTPCLAAIRKAEGIWIEDLAGRRYMDFHGNNVHHIGYGHPRLIAAIKAQLDELSFTPRRFTSEPAVALARKLAAIAPGNLGKVLFTTGGSDAVAARSSSRVPRPAATRRSPSGTPSTAPASAPPASAASSSSARVRSGRC
jgi:4-aminobutyrate aminotransferase